MTPLILDWAAARGAGPTRAGGKGWQLAVLTHFGVPVPPGFVIDAAASLGRRCGDDLPRAVQAALATELSARGWDRGPLAVRSSAPMEDSAGTSFAGIFTTCLNVEGTSAVVRAVQEVWDSLFTPAAQAYRERFGIGAEGLAMAVVVMPLLPAVAAGVAFTCDPVNGREDQVVIHANWGLGESLVDGQVEGDEYRFQIERISDRLDLIGQRCGNKTQRTEVSAGGGTGLQPTAADLASRQVLSAAQAGELAALVRDVAFALDYAQAFYDVEWVWDGTSFWIVQARPITVRGRRTYPALQHQPTVWSRANSRDVVPDPLAPLDWSLSLSVLNRMLTLTAEAGGYAPLAGLQRIALRHGRLYFETSILQWEAFDGFDVAPRAYNQLLGGHQPEISLPRPTLRDRLVRAGRSVRFLLGCVRPRLHARHLFARTHQWTAKQRALPLPADDMELARELRERVTAIRKADDLFILQAAGSALFILLDLLEKHFPGEGQTLTAALLTGGEPSVTAAQAYELMRLAETAAADPQALAWLRSANRVAAEWRRLPGTSPFRQGFADLLQRYGHRAVYESYLRNPRWREAPDYLLDNIVNLIGSNLAELQARQRSVAARARERLHAGLPARYRLLVPLLVRFAIVERNLREGARNALMAHLELVRRAALELGKRLDIDVFNLTLLELLAVAAGRIAPAAATNRAAWRALQLERHAATLAPEVIVEHGVLQPARGDPPAVGADLAGNDTGAWRGTVVGSGLAQGAAHVAHNPLEALSMVAGAILVAPSTDPSWTPVFLKAAGLVMETGGYMSHGAIVAREFGIPAVVNLPGILQQVRSGDRLEIDGQRGTVRRLPAR